MQEYLTFASANPILGVIFMLILAFVTMAFSIALTRVLDELVVVINRFIRHLNIRKAGWPPNHLDADGEFRNPPDDD